jgi:hypothetical protein
MRGRALACAALLLCGSPVITGAPSAQTVRTRDAGFSAVKYDNGLTVSALTVYEALIAERPRSTTSANGVMSLFDDGKWSMQGSLRGTRFSTSVPITPQPIAGIFRSMRGEYGLAAYSTAQQGAQPTLELVTEARAHFIDAERGLWLGGGVARTFDGVQWRTSVLGESGLWFRHKSLLVTTTVRPYQLQYGDLIGDAENSIEWRMGRVAVSANSGIRLGEALRGTVQWAGMSLSFPIVRSFIATASGGKYPTDLLQGLPGGYYGSLTMRIPSRRSPGRNLRASATTSPTPVDGPGTIVLTLADADQSRGTRVLRLRVPGARRVDVMADFTEWEPVSLVLSPTGLWETTVALPSGTHRLNVRIDGGEWIVPTNTMRVRGEFGDAVGMIVVP